MARTEAFKAGRQDWDCKDCGRDADHRWHQPGLAMEGDGSVHHQYNPEGGEFQRLTPS
jgi:hypothetical protein